MYYTIAALRTIFDGKQHMYKKNLVPRMLKSPLTSVLKAIQMMHFMYDEPT
jgi:hypothetical protein